MLLGVPRYYRRYFCHRWIWKTRFQRCLSIKNRWLNALDRHRPRLTNYRSWSPNCLAQLFTNFWRPNRHRLLNPFVKAMLESESSPYERCSPRYHISASPDWHCRDITPRNPLHLLTPFPIQSSPWLQHREYSYLRFPVQYWGILIREYQIIN